MSPFYWDFTYGLEQRSRLYGIFGIEPAILSRFQLYRGQQPAHDHARFLRRLRIERSHQRPNFPSLKHRGLASIQFSLGRYCWIVCFDQKSCAATAFASTRRPTAMRYVIVRRLRSPNVSMSPGRSAKSRGKTSKMQARNQSW